jgi:hypothetical protein
MALSGSAADALCLVELRGRLSNPAVAAHVAEVGQLADGIKADTRRQSTLPTAPTTLHRRWRLVDRLGEQIICDLRRDGRSGVSQRMLAERYGISVSSVKRLLRKRRPS